MPYALKYTGTSNYVSIPEKTGGAAAGLIFDFDVELTNYTTAFLFGRNTTGNESSVRINSATSVSVRIGTLSTRTIALAANSIPLATKLNIKGYKTSTPTFDIHVNDVLVGSTAISGSGGELTTAFQIALIGSAASPTGKFAGKIYRANLFGLHEYLNSSDANASTWGDGTLVNFPTDGTQWEFYSSGSTPVAFSGTIPTQNATVGVPFTLDVASYYTGTLTPFTYALATGDLTGTGLSRTGSVISGTPTGAGAISNISTSATDTGSNVATSNTFAINVAAAAAAPAGVPVIGTISVTQTTASVPYTYPLNDQTGFEYQVGAGSVFTASASPQALSGLTAGTPYQIRMRAVNATGPGAWSAYKSFTTAAVPVGTITIPDVVNNTDTPWTSAAVDAATVMPLSLGSVLVNKTGLSVTVGAELVITDAAITTGTEYIIILKIGTAYGWYRAVAT